MIFIKNAIKIMKVRYFAVTHLPHNQNSSIYCESNKTLSLKIILELLQIINTVQSYTDKTQSTTKNM